MMEQRWRGQLFAHSELLRATSWADLCGESAEMSACLELLRLGVMALHGETLGQRATIHGAVRDAWADRR